MKRARDFWVAFIPKYVSSRVFLTVYQMLAWIKVPRKIREENYVLNRERLREWNSDFWNSPGVYIENQDQWKNIQFGAGRHRNMCYSGCEILASFNAWKALTGCKTSGQMAELIAAFEARGAALWGEFGTSPRAVAAYFRREGFSVSTAYGEEYAKVDRIAGSCQVLIATVYNDREDITKQVHTVCITFQAGRGYVLHNAYLINRKGEYVESIPYQTVMEAVGHISRFRPKLIYLIGISR